jgi:L-ascorbate metabolism protein UlaG (beta-lactamase superfamily)
MKYNQNYYLFGGCMKISWYGHTCFRLVSRGLATVVTDPYDHTVVGYKALNLRSSIVSVCQDSPHFNHIFAVKSKSRVLKSPGEFEIGNVFITAVRTNGKKRNTDELGNTLYVFDFDGISVAHLGNMRRVPSQSRIEALGTINIALVPIGGKDGLNAAKAVEVISLLEPGIVIPMLYSTPHSKLELDPLDKFLKEMGLGQLKAEKELDITSSAIPAETRVVVLDYEI